jgi:hypothetical protein
MFHTYVIGTFHRPVARFLMTKAAFSGRYRGENSVAAIGDLEHLAAQTIL